MKTRPIKETDIKPRYPALLLQGTSEEKILYFKDEAQVNHCTLKSAMDLARTCIGSIGGSQIAIIAGPTGVGKTTMARGLSRYFKGKYAKKMAAEPDFVPVMYGNAVPPAGRNFDWKDFYIRLLMHAGEILCEKKIQVPLQLDLYPELRLETALDGNSPATLRRAVEKCLKHRRTKILIIDEAHHMLMAGSLEIQFENIKALAMETGCIIVLIGTYRLLDIRDQSAQLVRRSNIVHFPRYDNRHIKPYSAFLSALVELRSHIPIQNLPEFAPHLEFFYRKSGGCIGILKDWLTKCLMVSLTEAKPFDLDLLEKCALSNREMITIMDEIFAGEEKLTDVSDEEIDYYQQHGSRLPSDAISSKKVGDTPVKASSSRRVGQRLPKRDSTGGNHAGT